MSKLQEILDTQKEIEDSLLSRMSEFEKQLKFTTAPDSKPSLEKLSKDFDDFKNTVWSILTSLRSLVYSLTAQVDNLDYLGRRNALLFTGIQECDGEDCSATILNIIHSYLGLKDIQVASIQSCHRLGSMTQNKNRPILVRFETINSRNLVWREKKKLKSSSIVLSEFLTKTKQAMFVTARKHFGNYCCWTQDGQLFIKLSDSERKRIQSSQELNDVMTKYPMAPAYKKLPMASRSGASIVAASVPEPPVTRRNAGAKNK